MKAPSLTLLLALTAFAQPPAPEIRGLIAELGTRVPLAGATASLYEFAPNEQSVIVRKLISTTTTGPDGTFSFKPGRLGRFMVGVAKDGYSSGGNSKDSPLAIADLDDKTPVVSLRVSLTRPGTLTGRVIDRDGTPVANQRVRIDLALAKLMGANTTVTDAEGVFTQQNLTPGAYIVSIAPEPRDEKAMAEGEELTPFTDDAFKIVDQDVEPSYWPGGLSTPDQVLPVTVSGGGIANVGTITIRKVPYYRVRVSLNGECLPNERWTFEIRPANQPAERNQARNQAMDQRLTSCHKDAIIARVAPGAYELALWSGRDATRWALIPFTVKDENIAIPLSFNQSALITGRVSTPNGGPDLTTLGGIFVMMRSSQGLPSNKTMAQVQNGTFTFESVPWKSQWVSVNTFNSNVYVKEIRYNGQPLRTPDIEASNGSNFEIVVDQGAATLKVVLKEGDSPAGGFVALASASLTTLPPVRPPFEPFLFISEVRDSGPITISHIPPGDYRVVTAPLAQLDQVLDDETALSSRFAQATKVTLERGEQKSIEVQVKP